MVQKLLIFAAAALLFFGCASKSGEMVLKNPTSRYSGELASGQKVRFGRFVDGRLDAGSTVTVYDMSGNVTATVALRQDVGAWLGSAIKQEAHAAGLVVNNDALVTVEGKITRLDLKYVKNPAKPKNITVNAEAQMVLYIGGQKFTRNYRWQTIKYSAMLSDPDQYAPYIEEILSDAAVEMTQDIVRFVKEKGV